MTKPKWREDNGATTKTWNSSLSLTSMVMKIGDLSQNKLVRNVSDLKALVFLKLFVIFLFWFFVSILYMHAMKGLLRCGKSCRLRWINYLRPDVKRGNFSVEEEETIIKLHQSIGSKYVLSCYCLVWLKVFGWWRYLFCIFVSGGRRLLLNCQDEQTTR